MIDWLIEARLYFDYTQRLRRDFHTYPELGYQEIRTAGIISNELHKLGLEVTSGVAKTGVVTVLKCRTPGPVVLLRFDMDALPIGEETGAVYASQNPGIMHACGHDGHSAIGLTVARLLHKHRNELVGTVKFIFQPAEEGLCGAERGGAEQMVLEGVLENPRPDHALGLHLWNEKPLGWIGISNGSVMAGAEEFKILIKGKGGHGAIPNLCIDPILAASQTVISLQSIVSRNVSPLQSAVVSVSMIHGGDAFNVIPPEVILQGTIRTFELSVRENVLKRFDEIVRGTSEAMGCQVDITIKRLSPAVINDAGTACFVQSIAHRIFPDAVLSTADYITMGAEDMAFFLENIPGCYIFIGSSNPGKGLDAGHHHPSFDFDEQALITGAALIAASAAEMLTTVD